MSFAAPDSGEFTNSTQTTLVHCDPADSDSLQKRKVAPGAKAVRIAEWERTKADLLYYKGDIITLWIFVSKICDRYEDQDLYAPPILSSTPNLIHLLLRQVECAFLLRKMTSNSVKVGINHGQLIFVLDSIIETPKVHPELLTRAMILRVAEQCQWGPNGVKDIYNSPASETLKQSGFRSSKSALSIHEDNATSNGPAVNFTHAMVRRSLGYSLTQGEWANVCKALPKIDRDDLYFSMKGLTQAIFQAVSTDNAAALRECLPALNETLSLGEWGKIFYDKWWKGEEQNLVGTALWKKASVGIWADAPPPPILHANTIPFSTSSSGRIAKTIASAVGKAAVSAVANAAVHEVADSIITGNNQDNSSLFSGNLD